MLQTMYGHVLLVILALWGSLFSGLAITPAHMPSAITSTTTATVVKVIDGDTIDVILGKDTEITRVRYIGIDTPEPYAEAVPECGSEEASLRNQELVSGRSVTLVPGTDPLDKYGRLLAYVYVDDTFVNETLIKEGFATVMMIKPNTQYQTSFINLYTTAWAEKIGIWTTCRDL